VHSQLLGNPAEALLEGTGDGEISFTLTWTPKAAVAAGG